MTLKSAAASRDRPLKTELHTLTGLELAGKIRRKEVSAREAVADLFARIERLEPPLHAYLALDRAGGAGAGGRN